MSPREANDDSHFFLVPLTHYERGYNHTTVHYVTEKMSLSRHILDKCAILSRFVHSTVNSTSSSYQFVGGATA